MGKSRIFLIGLIAFIAGVGLARFSAVEFSEALTAGILLLGLILIFDDRPVKIFAFWALLLTAGLAYPLALGRDQLVTINQNSWLVVNLLSVKNLFLSSLDHLFQEPYAALAKGFTLAGSVSLPSGLKRSLIATGVIHIVAISGQNFTILLKIFADQTRSWGKYLSFTIGTLVIIVFTILTGGQPSIIRAAAMGWLFLLAPTIGRLPNITNALALTAAIMLIFEPKLLTESLNFQLSLLSMLGIIFIEPKLTNFFESRNWQKYLPGFVISALATTLAAQLATLGLVLTIFGRLSLTAPIVNVVIAPFVPLAMVMSFISGLGGLIAAELGQAVAFPTWLLLKAVIAIVDWFARFDFSSLKFQPWPWRWAVGYYIIILLVLWLTSSRVSELKDLSKSKS